MVSPNITTSLNKNLVLILLFISCSLSIHSGERRHGGRTITMGQQVQKPSPMEIQHQVMRQPHLLSIKILQNFSTLLNLFYFLFLLYLFFFFGKAFHYVFDYYFVEMGRMTFLWVGIFPDNRPIGQAHKHKLILLLLNIFIFTAHIK